MKNAETAVLNNGVNMPRIGFGVFQLEKEQCYSAAVDAIQTGYRLIDTASAYHNEEAVGNAVNKMVEEGVVRREELFLTTKVWLQDYGESKTEKSVERSMEKLQCGVIDLVLLHQPFGDWKQAWKALESLYDQGKVRAIGVSNFTSEKMKELLSFCSVKPAINQIERHPFYTQNAYCSKMEQEGIQVESWGSLAEGQMGIFEDPTLKKIAERHHKSNAEVAIRWNLQKNSVVLVGSSNQKHIEEDFDVFDFSLSEDEMQAIDRLDRGYSEIIDFNNPVTERLLLKAKI